MFWTVFGTLGDAGDDPPPQDASSTPDSGSPEPAKGHAEPPKPPSAKALPAIPLARRPTPQTPEPAPGAVSELADHTIIGLAQPHVATPPAESPAAPTPVTDPEASNEPIPIRKPAQSSPPSPPSATPPPTEEPKPAPPPAPPQAAAPPLGTFQAQKSKYYSGMVLDPVSGTHYDADTGKPLEAVKASAADLVAQVHFAATSRQLSLGAGALTGLALLGVALTRVVPQLSLWWLGILVFVGGMVMPLLRVAPFGEDDSSDVPIGIGLFLIVGPVVGTIAYGVIGALRSTLNPAVLGLGIIYIVIRIPIDLIVGNGSIALFSSLMPFTSPAAGYTWATHLTGMYLVYAGMAGWYAAGMFHQLDE